MCVAVSMCVRHVSATIRKKREGGNRSFDLHKIRLSKFHSWELIMIKNFIAGSNICFLSFGSILACAVKRGEDKLFVVFFTV